MDITFQIDNQTYKADLTASKSIAITLNPNEGQPNHFGAPNCTSETLEMGDYIGDTRRGGSCNVNTLTLIPHCNGTHTESVSHIIDELFPVFEMVEDEIFPCVLISVRPTVAKNSNEYYDPCFDESNLIITKQMLEKLLGGYSASMLQGLVVRTLDNDASKLHATYDQNNYPPYFTNDAMKYLVERKVKHLMVDIPSVDKMYDEGLLSNHRIFWNIEPKKINTNSSSTLNKTITEMVYVDDQIEDGIFLCNLQLPKIKTDAVPSNPVLYQLKS